MRRLIIGASVFVVLAGAVMVLSALAQDPAPDVKHGAKAPHCCSGCGMMGVIMGTEDDKEMPPQMKEKMENMKTAMKEAGVDDEMIMQTRAKMNAPLSMECPAVMLGMAKDLSLDEQQKTKLMDIEKNTRKEAMAVLTAEQVTKLGKISEPMSMADTMHQMHDKLMPVMEKMKKEGKMMPMACPMMKKECMEKHGKKGTETMKETPK